MMNNMPMDERALIQALGMGGGMPQGGGMMPSMPMDDASILQALGYMAGPQSVPMGVMGMPQMQGQPMPMPMMGQMPQDNYGADARMRMMQQVNPDGQPLQTQPMLAEFLKKYGNKVGR